MVRDYKAITNARYRAVVNWLLPIGFGIVELILNIKLGDMVHYAMLACIILAEVIGDYFGFGCICKKNCLGMEYLKTSHKGMDTLKAAIKADVGVRFIRIAIYTCIAYAWGMANGSQDGRSIVCTYLIILIISVGAINITRYVETMQIIYFIAIPIVAVGAIAESAMMETGFYDIKAIFLLLTIAIAGSTQTLRHMNYRIDHSFEDRD